VHRVGSDRRQAENLVGLGCGQCFNDSVNHLPRSGVAGLGIEFRRRQDEDRRGARECSRERRRILHLGKRHVAAERRPCLTLPRITHDCANGLIGVEQGAGELAADFAANSSDGVRLVSSNVCVRTRGSQA
jgi:hypothetical protein